MTERDEQLLTVKELMRLLATSRRTLERLLEDDPGFPRPIKLHKGERWILADIRAWQMRLKLRQELLAELTPKVRKPGQFDANAPEGEKPPSKRKNGG